ncbi:MAG: arginine repressor [Planctomycetota bacterium]
MSARAKRHNLIAVLLAKAPIASQDALQRVLASEGITTTQATLSRDLRELGVVKGPTGYILPGAMSPESWGAFSGQSAELLPDPVRRAVRDYVISVQPGVGLVVLKTGPGHAQVVALEMDRFPPPGVAGTIAGDDTIFVALTSAESVEPLLCAFAGAKAEAETQHEVGV